MKTSTSSGIDRQNLTNLAVGAVLKAGFNPERETVLLDIPLHGNIGDSLITLGEIALLQQFPQATWIHAGSNRDQLGPTLTRIPAHSNVLLQGGGNLGDLWPRSQIYRLDVTEQVHKTARVIWLPQSVYFEDVDGPLVARTRQVLAKHRPAVLLRDIQSMRLWNDLFDHPAILCPDLGMLAQASPDLPVVPGEVLKLFREESPVEWWGLRVSGEAA